MNVVMKHAGVSLSGDVRRALNDPALIEARDRHFARLEALFAGECDTPIRLWGVPGQAAADPYVQPGPWLAEALQDLANRAEAVRDKDVFRPPVIEFGLYGVRFVDRIFGATVYPSGDTWWGNPLEVEVGELAPPDLDSNPTWAQARDMAERFLMQDVALPLFGLPTIASTLNVAANLHGDRLYMALLEYPDRVRHDLEVINDTLIRLHRWYLDRVPADQLQPVVAAMRTQPRGHGQLCGCATHLLSGELYAALVAPLDETLLGAYPQGGMIHLCGAHTRHLATWRAMKPLKAVQLNDRAAEDLEAYYRGLREDQVIYLNPTKTMTVERAVEITGGRRLVLVTDRTETGTCRFHHRGQERWKRE